MATEMVFKRVEKKYLIDKDTYDEFIKEINPYMQMDQYGLHTICNIYFDTNDYDLVSRSIDKPVYKEKIRLRCYGTPSKESTSFIEIKKKFKGIVYKRREAYSYDEAKNFMLGKIHPLNNSQITKEIDYFLDFYNPVAKLYLAYDREAFFSTNEDMVRMTIDRNIRYREDDIDMLNGDYGERLFDEDLRLLEIKVADAFPLWLTSILTKLKIYPTSFSKYGNIYKKCNDERRNDNVV